MANNQENYERRTSLPHWVSIFRSQSNSSGEDLSQKADRPQHIGAKAPPSHQAKCQCKSGHPVVAGFPTKLEWGRSHAPIHLGRHSSPRPLHGRCRNPGFRSIFSRCLDNGNLVTMPTEALHTVERAICHCSRSSHLGVKVANKEDQSLL